MLVWTLHTHQKPVSLSDGGGRGGERQRMFIAAPGRGIRTAQGGKDNRQNNVLFKDGSVIYKAVKRPEEEGWNRELLQPCSSTLPSLTSSGNLK